MTTGIRHILMSILAILSLGAASLSACTCSHHVEPKVVENDCHSHHETVSRTELANAGLAFDEECTCAIQQWSPCVVSKSLSKEFGLNDVASTADVTIDLEFTSAASYREPGFITATQLSHSSTPKSLLPARAPPRL
jgi:hypothetical protein